MAPTDHPYTTVLNEAARRTRNDGRCELESTLTGQPPRPVNAGLLADVFAAAATGTVALYEGRGWPEAEILRRISDLDRAVIALAQEIVEPASRS